MKANELMFGDWVKHLNNPSRIKGAVDLTLAKDFEPIPLTPEILEKNGWWYNVEDMWLHDEVEFSIEKWKGRFQCYDINQIKLDYVHELQRALRCCELTDLADNFKV